MALDPGWITAVSCSIPCPSTSKACGMLPTFATVNVTVPAVIECSESSTFHSDSLALTVAGSPGARFEAVVLPHLDAAYTLARYLARNEHDAEDVVQDACLRALKYFDGFRGEEGTSARAWLLAIVRNTAFSSRRRQRPDAVVLEFDEAQHSGAVADEHPEAALLRSAAKESLGRALDRLAPEFRDRKSVV